MKYSQLAWSSVFEDGEWIRNQFKLVQSLNQWLVTHGGESNITLHFLYLKTLGPNKRGPPKDRKRFHTVGFPAWFTIQFIHGTLLTSACCHLSFHSHRPQQPIDSPTTTCLPEEQWPVRAPHRWESWKTTSIPRPPGKNTENRPATGPGDNWTWYYDLSELMENDIEWNNEWYTWNNDIVDDDWWCTVLWIIIWILCHNFSVLQPRIDSSARMWLAQQKG